jgi:hypothetical protein
MLAGFICLKEIEYVLHEDCNGLLWYCSMSKVQTSNNPIEEEVDNTSPEKCVHPLYVFQYETNCNDNYNFQSKSSNRDIKHVNSG